MSNTHYYSKSEIEETFRFFDKDGSGFIDDNELYEAMKKLKNNITRDQVSTIMAKIDTDHSGKVSMAEFVKLMS
jgi:Ca2+-binding EF-hand superfamily protein